MSGRPCPHCGEEILAAAIKCRFCGVALDKNAVAAERAATRPAEEGSRRLSLPWVALLGVGLVSGVCLGIYHEEWSPTLFVKGLEVLCFAGALGGLVLCARDLTDRRRAKVLGLDCFGVAGVLGLCALVCALLAPNMLRPRGPSNESQAIGALKTIATAQALFRESDKEGDGNLDYGTLAELANCGTTGLIDSVLGSGTKSGYVFTCTYGASTSEFIWFATATPALPTATGDMYFAINHEGVVFYTDQKAFRLDSAGCTVPAGVSAVGR